MTGGNVCQGSRFEQHQASCQSLWGPDPLFNVHLVSEQQGAPEIANMLLHAAESMMVLNGLLL